MKTTRFFLAALFWATVASLNVQAEIPWELEQGIVRLPLPKVNPDHLKGSGFKEVELEATVVDADGTPVPHVGSEKTRFKMDFTRWENSEGYLQEDLLWVVRSAVPLEKRKDLKIRTKITFERGLIAPPVKVTRDFSVLDPAVGDPIDLLRGVTISLSEVKQNLSKYTHALIFVRAAGEEVWSPPKAVDLKKGGLAEKVRFTLPPSIDGEGVGKYDVRIQMIGEDTQPIRWIYENIEDLEFAPRPKKA